MVLMVQQMVSLHILENCYIFSVLMYDIIINSDDEHEGKEDTSATENVPDIMPEQGDKTAKKGDTSNKKDKLLTCRKSPKDSKAGLTPVILQASCWSPSQSF